MAAIIGGIGPTLVLLGVHLSAAQEGGVNDLKVIALGLFSSDAVVRVGRNIHQGMAARVALPLATGVNTVTPDRPQPTGPQSPSADALAEEYKRGYDAGVAAATGEQPDPENTTDTPQPEAPVPLPGSPDATVREPDSDDPRPDDPHRA